MATGYRDILLTSLGRKPRGSLVAGAWRYLVGAHESVTGLFDALATVRSTKPGLEARGRLARDETDLLRAAVVFTSSGLDACCKRLLRDALPTLIDGNDNAGRKFQEFLKQELAAKPSGAFAQAILSRAPRDELIKVYIAVATRASMQASGDLKSRVRDTLGITNAQLPVARLEELDNFFVARNAIVHDLDYQSPSSISSARNSRPMEEVREQCNSALLVVADVISSTAQNLRTL